VTRLALEVLEPYAEKFARTVLRGRKLPGLGAMAIRKIKCKIVSIYGNIFVFLSVLNDR